PSDFSSLCGITSATAASVRLPFRGRRLGQRLCAPGFRAGWPLSVCSSRGSRSRSPAPQKKYRGCARGCEAKVFWKRALLVPLNYDSTFAPDRDATKCFACRARLRVCSAHTALKTGEVV